MSSPAQRSASQDVARAVPTTPARGGSRLGRLFSYSKDTAFSAQENFTTEALALAILESAEPMLGALRVVAKSLSAECPQCPFDLDAVETLRPRTQVYIRGGGFLDLVLDALDQRRVVVGEVWLEVKVTAPESGDQLNAYRREAQQRVRPVWLLTVGPKRLRSDIPHLPWMDLYQTARLTRPEPPAWADLRKFMEEQEMANDALGPISDREAASLEAAFDFVQKASAVIARVHRSLPEIFPASVVKKILWRSDDVLLNSAAAGFRRSGEYAGFGPGLSWGVASVEGTAYWFIAVMLVGDSPDRADATRRAALPELWERPAAGPKLLVARVRATAKGDHAEASAWFLERLKELNRSGALAEAQGITTSGPHDGESEPATFRQSE